MKIDRFVNGMWVSVYGKNEAECEAKIVELVGVKSEPNNKISANRSSVKNEKE
jgi:hypothetical protein